MFGSLEIHNWRQIEHLRIKFHDTLTILTGANGSGKTTILNLLAKHYGWNVNLVGTPKRDRKSGLLEYLPDFLAITFWVEVKPIGLEHVMGRLRTGTWSKPTSSSRKGFTDLSSSRLDHSSM